MAAVSPPAPAHRLDTISAGWRYSSGSGHFAYDYPMPQGTALYAVRDGVVTDCQDGVKDYTPGSPGNYPGQPGSGSPSNWILLQITYKGRPATVYYQHLYDTKVVKGQKVKAGQLLGYSGQTGNATGNHLHIAAMRGGGYDVYDRYVYMLGNGQNPPPPSSSKCIWPPSRTWSWADIVDFSNLGMGEKNNDVLVVQQALAATVGLDYAGGVQIINGVRCGTWGPKTAAAWLRASVKYRKTGLALLKHLGYLQGFTGVA